MKKRLYKSSKDKKICGVCAGLADYFELDSTVVRILWLIMLFVFGTGVLAYIICALRYGNNGRRRRSRLRIRPERLTVLKKRN